MYRLLRYYNQNRRKVWATIIIIIFALVLIQLFNQFAKEKREEGTQTNIQNEVNNTQKDYESESKSIISGDKVYDQYKDDFGSLIDEFYTYCINHEPKKAYELLSKEMKEQQYPTEQLFEQLYYKTKFEGDKQYSFQSWSSSTNINIYLVKIYENMLTTGKKNDEYIEDYVTVIGEDDNYKLNINKYIKKRNINKQAENEQITVKVNTADTYLEYEIYAFTIKNNTNSKLLLDTKEKSKTLCVVDNNGNRYDSYLYENNQEDLILEPYQSKTIKIKFNNRYSQDLEVKKIVFSDIVNYDEYLQSKETEKKEIQIDV